MCFPVVLVGGVGISYYGGMELDGEKAAAFIAGIPGGGIGTLLCGDAVDVLAALEDPFRAGDGVRLVAYSWPCMPVVDAALRDVTERLARLAGAVWPGWYGGVARFGGEGEYARDSRDAAAVQEILQAREGVNVAWLRAALRCCRAGRLPLPRGFAHEVHAAQLVRAVAPERLVLCLALEREQEAGAHLLAFARVTEWVARETGARVAALVPEAHGKRPELDAILHGAETLPREHAMVADLAGDERPSVVVPPIVGCPHPESPGEQLLAQWLARDAELAPLFGFNQWVEVSNGERFLVDLLWVEGRLVVEVDGYAWHSRPHAFRQDRYRDYRLMLSGYLVLRLPHDAVMADVALQAEKIRDMVHYLRQRPKI